jgi:hypothetical protein
MKWPEMEERMKASRWKLGVTVSFLSGILLATPVGSEAWQARPAPQPRPSPNAPSNQNAPQGLDGRPLPVESKEQSLDRQNQQEIRMEVQRLYAMVTELKDEVDKTNANAVLSVAVLKRAQDIEKLAKQIRDRAKR